MKRFENIISNINNELHLKLRFECKQFILGLKFKSITQ